MERTRRRREKNLSARAMSRAICARSSSGPLNFFSSRRRSQNLTSIRFGGEESCASKRCVSTLSADPLNVGRIPMLVTERRRCARHVAPGNFLADERARDNLASANHRRKDHHLEPVLRAQLPEQMHIACLLVPEAKVFPDKKGLDTQVAQQDPLDELIGSETRQFQGERKHDGSLQSERVEACQALRDGRDLRRGRLWAKNFSRRRIEGQRRGYRAQCASARRHRPQDGLMSEMNAVETANGQHAALPRLGKPGSPRFRGSERGEASRSSSGNKREPSEKVGRLVEGVVRSIHA